MKKYLQCNNQFGYCYGLGNCCCWSSSWVKGSKALSLFDCLRLDRQKPSFLWHFCLNTLLFHRLVWVAFFLLLSFSFLLFVAFLLQCRHGLKYPDTSLIQFFLISMKNGDLDQSWHLHFQIGPQLTLLARYRSLSAQVVNCKMFYLLI